MPTIHSSSINLITDLSHQYDKQYYKEFGDINDDLDHNTTDDSSFFNELNSEYSHYDIPEVIVFKDILQI